MKNYVVSAVIAAVVVVVGLFVYHPAPVVEQVSTTPPFGSVTGPDVNFQMFFHNNVNIGGTDFATTSQGASTYTAASFAGSHVIEHIAPAAETATLPTNATLSAAGFLPNVGDTQTIYIHASTTKVTLVGNTGVTLASASSTTAISAGSLGELNCTRLGATESRLIVCLLIAD